MRDCSAAGGDCGAADGYVFPAGASVIQAVLRRLLAVDVGRQWRHRSACERTCCGDFYVERDQYQPARGYRLLRAVDRSRASA